MGDSKSSGESISSGASSRVEAGLNLCVECIPGRGERMEGEEEPGSPLIVNRGGAFGVSLDRDSFEGPFPGVFDLADFGGVARGLMVGGAFISADLKQF